MPEVLRAAQLLEEGNVGADIVCLTSADLLFRASQARQGLGDGECWILEEPFPSERPHPIVTVIDGHPHTLSFLGTVQAVPTTLVGVSSFGRSGDLDDLYERCGTDVETVTGATLDIIG